MDKDIVKKIQNLKSGGIIKNGNKNDSGGSIFKLLVMMMIMMFMMYIMYMIYKLKIKKLTMTPEDISRSNQLNNLTKSNAETMEELGLDASDFITECMYTPAIDGMCSDDFKLVESGAGKGCCEPKDVTDYDKFRKPFETIKMIVLQIGMQHAIDKVLAKAGLDLTSSYKSTKKKYIDLIKDQDRVFTSKVDDFKKMKFADKLDTLSKSSKKFVADMGKQIPTSKLKTAAGEVSQFIIRKGKADILKLSAKSSFKAGTRVSAKAAVKGAAQLAKRGLKKGVTTGVRTGAKMASKFAVKGAIVLASGPAMPAAAAVFIISTVIEETITTAINAVDISGYNLGFSYPIMMKIRNECIIQARNFFINDLRCPPDDYPPSMDILNPLMYPSEVIRDFNEDFEDIVGWREFVCGLFIEISTPSFEMWYVKEDPDYFWDKYMNEDKLIDADFEKIDNDFIRWFNLPETKLELEKFTWECLNAKIREEEQNDETANERMSMFEFYPNMSAGSVFRTAISLSKKGQVAHNDNVESAAFQLDFQNPAASTEDMQSVVIAALTDVTYISAGTSSNEKNGLSETVKINNVTQIPIKSGMGMYGMPMVAQLWAMCEQPQLGGAPSTMGNIWGGNTSLGKLEPRKYNVEFDKSTLLCKYTKSYCDRMGLDWKPETNSCALNPGQDLLEQFLPKEVVRGAKKYLAVEEAGIGDYCLVHTNCKGNAYNAGAGGVGTAIAAHPDPMIKLNPFLAYGGNWCKGLPGVCAKKIERREGGNLEGEDCVQNLDCKGWPFGSQPLLCDIQSGTCQKSKLTGELGADCYTQLDCKAHKDLFCDEAVNKCTSWGDKRCTHPG